MKNYKPANEHLSTPLPLRFDGQGVNDANGQRIGKLSIPSYIDTKRQPEYDRLSQLFMIAPELYDVARLALKSKDESLAMQAQKALARLEK